MTNGDVSRLDESQEFNRGYGIVSSRMSPSSSLHDFVSLSLLGQSVLQALKHLDLDPSLSLVLLGSVRGQNFLCLSETSADALKIARDTETSAP
jgi:hypothetical protein